MANPSTKTDIINLAYARIGEKAVTEAQIAANTIVLAQRGNLHYEQTRDALLRSHWWRFASDRAALTATADPSFEWDNAFSLPTDFLRFKSFYEDNNTFTDTMPRSFALEGSNLLTNESAANIRYIKQVTDVEAFDSLFIEVFVLTVALKMVLATAGAGAAGRLLYREIKEELYKEVMPRVRTMDRQETNTLGRMQTWVSARLSRFGRIDSRLGSP